jgi:hypothetical protein
MVETDTSIMGHVTHSFTHKTPLLRGGIPYRTDTLRKPKNQIMFHRSLAEAGLTFTMFWDIIYSPYLLLKG